MKLGKGGGGLRQSTTVFYPIYYDDDMFRPLWDIFRSKNYTEYDHCILYEHNLYSFPLYTFL